MCLTFGAYDIFEQVFFQQT